MTTRHPASRQALNKEAKDARQRASQAVHALVLDGGSKITTRQMSRCHPSSPVVCDAEPVPGMRAARMIELAARQRARDYIQQARQDGMGWHEIGAILGLSAGSVAGGTVAAVAYTYAAGAPDSEDARACGRSFLWRCMTCGEMVTDRGPESGHPAEAEPGHDKDCAQLAAAVAEWDAAWTRVG